MTAPANGYNPGNGQYGFVGSVVTGLALGDGYIQSDVVTWQGNGLFGAWGVGSRLNGLATPLRLTGYAVVYEPYGNGGPRGPPARKVGPAQVFLTASARRTLPSPLAISTPTLETGGSSIIGSTGTWGRRETSWAWLPKSPLPTQPTPAAAQACSQSLNHRFPPLTLRLTTSW